MSDPLTYILLAIVAYLIGFTQGLSWGTKKPEDYETTFYDSCRN